MGYGVINAGAQRFLAIAQVYYTFYSVHMIRREGRRESLVQNIGLMAMNVLNS